jgi:segregation and condensation protein B
MRQLESQMFNSELNRSLEAILMVVDEPVSEIILAQITEVPTEQVLASLAELSASYEEQGRGFELRQVAGGWRFYSHPDLAPMVEKFVLDGQQSRLTQAALETLAVIAYRQPVSRARVSAIRGVNVEAVMKTLVTRGLVEEAGQEPETGAILYRTTSFFLEKLGLNQVSDLPALAPFLPDVDGLDEVLSALTE